ncbi:ketol-acid reductoisomerase [Gynuella sp.]|uniref:ketol-acid reductoisomerase n=1 Tax=Gynuella sp. TaxID=2969146 RepID=UPI003D0BA35D
MRSLIAFMALISLFACTSSTVLPDKALVEPVLVVRAIELETTLNQRQGLPVPEHQNWFDVIEGHIPVIITAPHATRPLRNGHRRFSDGGGTAALAVTVAELTGAYVIYTTYEGPSDPNYYDENAFKTQLQQLITTVQPLYILDIHGSHPYRSYDIDLGTMNGQSLLGHQNLLKRLIRQLETEGISSFSYNRFAASRNETITKFAVAHGIPAIQLEINSTYVTPAEGNVYAQRFSILSQALARFINSSVTTNRQP